MRLIRVILVFVVLGGWLIIAAVRPAVALSWSPYGEPNRLSLSLGYFDVFDNKEAGVLNLEYRYRKGLWFIRPMAGFMITTDQTVYGYGGIYIDLPVTDHWILTPSLVGGGYDEGDGKDLGNSIEFRSKIELAYRFRNRVRISLGISHVSNAGLGNSNPGTEIVSLSYAIPFYPMHPPARRR